MIRPQDQRQVRELRRRKPQRLVEQHLARRIRNVILAADHVRHLHHRIVDDDGEVVGRPPVRSHEHRIADDVAAERHLTANEIAEGDVDPLRDPESNDRLLAGVDPAPRLVGGAGCGRSRDTSEDGRRRDPPCGPHRASPASRSSNRHCRRSTARSRTSAYRCKPLGLPIRPVQAADIGPLIPVEPEPTQVLEDARLGLASSIARHRCPRCAG